AGAGWRLVCPPSPRGGGLGVGAHPRPAGGGGVGRGGYLVADADIPHLSAELITKYVGDLRLHGLIA
ncbi:hypothetical protein, partial [Nocardia cyriacigeorgica]|uniref:hypothetical protein n=1 Tax=Nocardia cyriacigeorgica TaxID=135487 RepID=UPI0024578ABE